MTYENRGYRDVFGIAWLGCGLFTLLCVISFSPTDVSLYTTHPTSTNFIGPVGAHWAALLVFSLGLAAYAFPALACYLGLCLIFREAPEWRSKLISGLLLMVSIAGILHLQPYMGWAWAKEMNTISPGGFLGHTINSYVLTLLFGPMGACFSLILIYSVAFSAFFDLQPRRVMREINLAIANHYRRKEEERLRRATPKDLLEMKQKEITAQMKKLQQQLGGSSASDQQAPPPRAELPLAAPTMAIAGSSNKQDRRGSGGKRSKDQRDPRDSDRNGSGSDSGTYRDREREHEEEPELAGVGASGSSNPYASADSFFSGGKTAASTSPTAPARRRPAASGRSAAAASFFEDESEESAVATPSPVAPVVIPAPAAPLPRVIDGAGLGSMAKARPAAAPTEITPRIISAPAAPTAPASAPAPAFESDHASFISETFGNLMSAAAPAASSKAPVPAAAYKAHTPVARSAEPAVWPADSFFADEDVPFASGTGIAAPAAPAEQSAPMYSPYGDERYMPRPHAHSAQPVEEEEFAEHDNNQSTKEETDGSESRYEHSTQEFEEEELESDDDHTGARYRHDEDEGENEEAASHNDREQAGNGWYQNDTDDDTASLHDDEVTENESKAPTHAFAPAPTPVPAPAYRPAQTAASAYAPVPSPDAAQQQRPARTLGSIGVQAPRPFGPGAGSGAAAPAAPSSPAPVQNAPAAPVAPTFAAPTLGSVSPRPGSALPALFRGIEKRPTATAAPVPAPYVPAPAAEYAPEEEALEADHDQNQDHDQEKAQAETPAQHFPQSHLQTQQPAPQPLPQSQSFAPTRPASVPPAAASIVPAARPAVPQQQPAAGSMYRAVSQPAPAPAPLRPAPLPQSPEVMARRERERDSRNMPGSVPSVRLPGVGLPPDNQAQRTTAQRAPFDPFEIVPEFEQPPKPAFVAAQSAVSAPPASSPAQYSATPARPNQPVAGTPPPGGGGNMGNRMLATAHSGDSSEALNFGDYTLPPMEMLVTTDPSKIAVVNEAELQNNARLIVETLKQFGIQTTAGDITRGATITRYELYPAVGVRVDKILSLRRDIARTMRAERIQILAPIPGKNTVGVEIANKNKVPIVLRDLFEAPEWINSKARIPIALGKDVYGQVLVADLADMPHMLVAGTTGSGKSVCINSILLSFLYRFRPDELRLILVDPKQVEMAIYNTIPHLVVPVVTDPKKVLLALRWVINEMEKRYKILAKVGVRNIHAFNNRKPKPAAPGEGTAFEGSSAVEVKQQRVSFTASANDDDDDDGGGEEEEIFIPERMPFIVVIIDELADLMLTAPADVESAIARITAKARAAGIHLIVATQSPRKDVVTGIIKANIPSRVAFQVANSLDSRIILDESGAENLVGKGDLLYLPPGTSKLTRGQGAFVSDEEVNTIVQWCSAQAPNCFEDDINNKLSAKGGEHEDFSQEDIELIHKCWDVIRQEKRASTSMLQRRLRLGYNKAAWVVDFLERILVLGPGEGAKPREILVDLDDFELPI